MYRVDVDHTGIYRATLTDKFLEFRPFYCRPVIQARDWHIFQQELRRNIDKANPQALPAATSGPIQG